MDQRHADMFDAFINGRLGRDQWTHEAHLITCWVALRDRTPAEALPFLRDSIKTHNCGIGIQNTSTMGYHETLTQFYVVAVAKANAATPEELFDIPTCGRTAASEYWSREVLFSPDARADWVEPDRAPLPWDRLGVLVDEAA